MAKIISSDSHNNFLYVTCSKKNFGNTKFCRVYLNEEQSMNQAALRTRGGLESSAQQWSRTSIGWIQMPSREIT
jgi:hypothetical protein